MTSILEKYRWFQKGIVKANTTENWQNFFKTNPSEEQIMILDEIDKKNNLLWLLCVLLYFIGGLLLGWLIWNQLPLIASRLTGA
jgi:hypothetical protein